MFRSKGQTTKATIEIWSWASVNPGFQTLKQLFGPRRNRKRISFPFPEYRADPQLHLQGEKVGLWGTSWHPGLLPCLTSPLPHSYPVFSFLQKYSRYKTTHLSPRTLFHSQLFPGESLTSPCGTRREVMGPPWSRLPSDTHQPLKQCSLFHKAKL